VVKLFSLLSLIPLVATIFAMISNKTIVDLVGHLLFFCSCIGGLGFFFWWTGFFCFPSNAPIG
jgi:hypothetical protein